MIENKNIIFENIKEIKKTKDGNIKTITYKEDVEEELKNKADKIHTHEISDVNGLQNELNNKNLGQSETNTSVNSGSTDTQNSEMKTSTSSIYDQVMSTVFNRSAEAEDMKEFTESLENDLSLLNDKE